MMEEKRLEAKILESACKQIEIRKEEESEKVKVLAAQSCLTLGPHGL